MKDKIKRILIASEKYTETDMIYLTKGASWLTFGQVITTFGSFILAIAFANFLPKEIFGTYKFILSVASILIATSLGGMTNAIQQAVARGFEGSLIESVKTKIRWGIIGGIAGLILAGYYFFKGNLELSSAFALVAIFVPFIEAFITYESYLQGRRLFKEQTNLNIISRLISLSSLIITAFLSDNLFFILLAYFLPWTIVRYIGFLYTVRKFPPNDHVDKETISYGKHLSWVGVSGTFGNYLDNVLLFHYLGPVQVAIYSFALAPVEQIRALYKSINILSIPKLANRSLEEINRNLYKRMFQLLVIGIFIGGAYALASPILFKLVFPEYLDSIFFSQLLAILLVIRLPLAFLTSVIQSKLHITPKSWLYWRSIPRIILLISMVILTPLFGIIGVIISRIIFQISSFIANLIHWKLFMRGDHL